MLSSTKRVMAEMHLAAVLRPLAIFSVCIVVLFPLYWMAVTSVLPQEAILRYPPSFFPKDATIRAYVDVLLHRSFLRWMFNSITTVGASTLLALAISTVAGYSLSRFPSRLGLALGHVLLMTRMVPSTLIVIPLYLMFQRCGLLDTLTALVISYTTFQIPFATWMMKGYFASIPREIEEAALVDGCSEWTALLKVVLPLATPGLVASVLAAAILGWSDFVFARTLVSSEQLWTLTVGIQSFLGEHVTLWSHLMAASLIATLPILTLFLALNRFVVMGLTAGAIK
jgi:multiple sugar transport system permease protein